MNLEKFTDRAKGFLQAARIVSIMRATGIDGEWVGHDNPEN